MLNLFLATTTPFFYCLFYLLSWHPHKNSNLNPGSRVIGLMSIIGGMIEWVERACCRSLPPTLCLCQTSPKVRLEPHSQHAPLLVLGFKNYSRNSSFTKMMSMFHTVGGSYMHLPKIEIQLETISLKANWQCTLHISFIWGSTDERYGLKYTGSMIIFQVMIQRTNPLWEILELSQKS